MLALQGDLLDQEQVPAIFEKALDALDGRIDILVNNNAGIQRRHFCEDFPLRLERCHKSQFKYGISAVPACRTQYVARKSGKIINVAYMLKLLRRIHRPGHATSKEAVSLN